MGEEGELMTSLFNSFDQSPLGAFVQSPLGNARGLGDIGTIVVGINNSGGSYSGSILVYNKETKSLTEIDSVPETRCAALVSTSLNELYALGTNDHFYGGNIYKNTGTLASPTWTKINGSIDVFIPRIIGPRAGVRGMTSIGASIYFTDNDTSPFGSPPPGGLVEYSTAGGLSEKGQNLPSAPGSSISSGGVCSWGSNVVIDCRSSQAATGNKPAPTYYDGTEYKPNLDTTDDYHPIVEYDGKLITRRGYETDDFNTWTDINDAVGDFSDFSDWIEDGIVVDGKLWVVNGDRYLYYYNGTSWSKILATNEFLDLRRLTTDGERIYIAARSLFVNAIIEVVIDGPTAIGVTVEVDEEIDDIYHFAEPT